MLKQIIPGAKNALEQGVSVKFRHVADSIYIDISLEGMFAELFKSQLNSIKLDFSEFLESGEFNLVSGIKVDNLLDIGYEDLLKMGTLFKVQGKGQIPSKVFDSIFSQIEAKCSDHLPDNVKLGMKTLKLFGALRKIQYNSKYDSNVLYDYIRELAGKIVHNKTGGANMDELNHEMGSQIIASILSQTQEQAKSQLEVIKQAAAMFLEPYLDSVKALNLDEISMSFTVSEFNAQTKFKICLVGITEYLKNYILN